jgi:hypothetical protein
MINSLVVTAALLHAHIRTAAVLKRDRQTGHRERIRHGYRLQSVACRATCVMT